MPGLPKLPEYLWIGIDSDGRKIERAAELSGVKKSAFMREAALEKAARVLVAAG